MAYYTSVIFPSKRKILFKEINPLVFDPEINLSYMVLLQEIS